MGEVWGDKVRAECAKGGSEISLEREREDVGEGINFFTVPLYLFYLFILCALVYALDTWLDSLILPVTDLIKAQIKCTDNVLLFPKPGKARVWEDFDSKRR